MAEQTLKKLAVGSDEIKKGDLYRVNEKVIQIEPGFNRRDIHRDDVQAYIRDLAQSFLDDKPVPPIFVRVDDEGGIWLVDGECRLTAFRLALSMGMPPRHIDTLPFRGDKRERIAFMLSSGQKMPLTPLEVALGYRDLADQGLGATEIARAISAAEQGGRGVTPARIEQLLLLARASEEIHEMVRAGQCTADIAIEAIREHREDALAFLRDGLAGALASGRDRLTRAALRAPTLPRKVTGSTVAVVSRVINTLPKSTRSRLAALAAMPEAQRKGLTIDIPAQLMVELLENSNQIAEAEEKLRAREEARTLKAAQQDLPMSTAGR